jgi:hypothetical protein
MKTNTAILFITYNRPEKTKKVFDVIRSVKPPRIYLVSDGAKYDKQGDIEKVNEVREIIKNIDWPCEVNTLFRNVNLGCKYSPPDAITWFFSFEEKGIILEDDCLPSPLFFDFCEKMLVKYDNDNSIGKISGFSEVANSNLLSNLNGDYFYSKLGSIWGWATWRRVWVHYSIGYDNLKNFSCTKFAKYLGFIIYLNRYNIYYNAKKNNLNTWDYQFSLMMSSKYYNSIVPKFNLIENIGFDEEATHTFSNLIINKKTFGSKSNNNYYSSSYLVDKRFNKNLFYDKKIIHSSLLREIYIYFKNIFLIYIKSTYFIISKKYVSNKKVIKNINWEEIEYFDPIWNDRSFELFSFLRDKPINYIYDLGCGTQFLRKLVEPHFKYMPVDYKKRSNDTEICDFNKAEFPNIKIFDQGVIISGTLEYIINIKDFIVNLSIFKFISLSYCCIDDFPSLEYRNKQGWVNHLSQKQLINIMNEFGFYSQRLGCINNNRTFLFVKLI